MKKVFRIFPVVLFILILSFASAKDEKGKIENFSFYHLSDTHLSPNKKMPEDISKERSYKSISQIKNYGEIKMPFEGITAPKPSFIMLTGDITEFGFPGVVWQVLDKYFEGNNIPIYLTNGNHDLTWNSDTNAFRKKFGGLDYSFNYGGIHFVEITTPSIQEPIPSIKQETINFLKKDLAAIGKDMPVMIFFHHPLDSGEFCSKYDVDRLLDVLRESNVILALDGHGHAAVPHNFSGIDGIEGGSTFSDKKPVSGFNIINIKDRKLYAAYKYDKDTTAAKSLIQKEIPETAIYPKIKISSPEDAETIKSDNIKISAKISGNENKIIKASYSIDDEKEGELKFEDGKAQAEIPSADLYNGAHFVRIKFYYENEKAYQKSAYFFIEKKGDTSKANAKWRFRMDGSSASTPTILDDSVYVGNNDGNLYAFKKDNGKLKWKYNSGAEILTTPLCIKGQDSGKDKIIFGAGNGNVIAVNTKGEKIWEYISAAAVYSSPVANEKGRIYFGNNKGEITCVDSADGKEIWKKEHAGLAIESKPFIYKDNVYLGSWDGYLYCVNAENGELVWKKAGPKNQARVNTYYAPADNGPVVSNGKLIISDRGYVCGKYDAQTGDYIKVKDNGADKDFATGCPAVTLSDDGKSLYLRGMEQPVKKVDFDGKIIWQKDIKTGRFPISPTETGDSLYIISNSGKLYCMNKQTGDVKWEYQITPQMYVMSGTAVDNNGIVYAAGLDGYITAVEKK